MAKVIQLAYLLTHSELIKAGESRCKEVNRALAGKRFAMLRDPSAESNLYLRLNILHRARGVRSRSDILLLPAHNSIQIKPERDIFF
jgi:hypothetical protein